MRRPRGTVPLERALSKLGLASRTDARRLILDGRIAVNGRILRDPAAPVAPEQVRIAIDGQPRSRPEPVTLVLHKPRGVVTTRRDPEDRPTVYDCLTALDAHVVPVGRLDFATSGLLLLTNDTRLADWLTDPANAVPRVYLATVRGRFTVDEAAVLERGLHAAPHRAGNAPHAGQWVRAHAVVIRKASNRESHLVVTLVEGKNREIRRLLTAVGHDVTRLRRVQFGNLEMGDLEPGEWRRLSRQEIARAFPGCPPIDPIERDARRTRSLHGRAPRG